MTDTEKKRFSKIAESAREQSLVGELVGFLRASKKWWLAPVLFVLLSLGLLLLLSGTAAAPFIYTLF